MKPLEVQKFGGTSVADEIAVRQSISIVRESLQRQNHVLVVVSAMPGVTDKLKLIIKRGFEGMPYHDLMEEIKERYCGLIEKVADPRAYGDLMKKTEEQFRGDNEILSHMFALGIKSPTHIDRISSLGDKQMAPIFTAGLMAQGIDAVCYDAEKILATDSNFGNANPQIINTRERIKNTMVNDLFLQKVVVMGGYHGSDKAGHTATFSRGGSDLSATAMAHALTTTFDRIGVFLYKADVAGVMSADPRIVPDAHIIPHMDYHEAAALTVHGGKVIHPKAVHHAVRSGSSKRPPFPIYVRSTREPELSGTTIDNRAPEDDSPVKAVSLIKNAVRLTIEGWGMDRPGIMRTITGSLAAEGIDLDFISQPHSKLAFDLAFQYEGQEVILEELLKEGLHEQIKEGDIDRVMAARVGVVGVIGRGISDPMVLSRVIKGMNGEFHELKKPNACKVTTGMYEASILADLRTDRLEELVRSIHAAVFH